MTVAEQPDGASIASLRCRYTLPATGVDQLALRWRLDRVMRTGLADALAAALAPLDGADQGSVWVVRSMRAHAVVSATLDDLDLIARQWGGQLGDAILSMLRAGPGGNVVRFASRAQYVAAFAAALATRSAEGWVFEPLAGMRLLAPPAAIRTCADGAGIAVAEVIAELVRARQLETVLAGAAPVELAALWAECVGQSAGEVAGGGPVAAVRALAAERLQMSVPAAGRAELALRLFALAVGALGAGPEVVSAVDAVASALGEDAVVAPGAASDAAGFELHGLGEAAAGEVSAEPARSCPARRAVPASGDADVFAAHGAQSFMLLPALERVGLGAVCGAARALVLGRVLGLEPDAAIALAAGDGLVTDPVNGPAMLDVVRDALRADQRLDGRWLLTEIARHPDAVRRVALVRDVGSDTWLAGSVVGVRRRAPWKTLLAVSVEACGREPEVVLGAWPRAAGAAAPECAAAISALRAPAADLEWLSPGDEDELCAGLAARAALRGLARRLLGFGASSMAYLVDRFLPAGGIVATGTDRIHAELPAPALGVILAMAGLDTFEYRVPWLEQEVLVTHRGG